jgi:hypothetical protein
MCPTSTFLFRSYLNLTPVEMLRAASRQEPGETWQDWIKGLKASHVY